MTECEICGEEVEKVFRCKSCGTRFCEDCGSPKDKLCIDCLYEEEDCQEEYYAIDFGYEGFLIPCWNNHDSTYSYDARNAKD